MPSHGREVAYELRCVIVSLRLLLSPSANYFNRIAELLKLKTGTVQRIY